MKRFAILAMPIFFVGSCAAMADTPTDFSGDWVVQDKSDATPVAGDKSAADSAGRSHGSHGGGGGHMGGGHAGRGSRSDGSATSASFANADNAPVPRLRAHALIIRQSDDIFDIDADGRRMAYRFDGRHNYGPQYGGTVSLSWATPQIVIETHPDAGGSVEEHYQLSADAKTLTLLLRTQRVDGGTVEETRRVFVREGESTASGSGVSLP